MKKLFSILLCLALVLGTCSTALAYTVSDENVLPIVDEEITYTITTQDVTWIEDLNENTIVDWIKEKTNINVIFEEIPSSEYKEILNTRLAADEMADAIMNAGFSAADLANFGGQGLFLPLNDLIEEHGYNHKIIFDTYDALPGAYTALDGNIYTIANINECYHCVYSMRAWINQVWLDNLGLEYPETLDDLVTVLTAFRDQDANGNGDATDEIPFTGCANSWNTKIYPFLLNSFLYFDESYLSVQDGEVKFAAQQPEFKEGLEFIRGLIADGLIEAEALTQNNEQLKVKGSNPDAVNIGTVMGATYWVAFDAGTSSSADQRSREYVPLSPLEGPNGVRYSPVLDVPYQMGHTVITTACEDPVPLFKLFDFTLSDEATLRTNIGDLGENYELPPEASTGINGKPALYKKILKGEDHKNFTSMENMWPSNRHSDFRLGEWADYSDPETYFNTEPRLYNSSADYFFPYAAPFRFPTVNMTLDEAEQNAFWKTNIDDYTKEQIVRFLAGERSFDEWDDFIAGYDSLNLTEYVELLQTAYDRQYGS